MAVSTVLIGPFAAAIKSHHRVYSPLTSPFFLYCSSSLRRLWSFGQPWKLSAAQSLVSGWITNTGPSCHASSQSVYLLMQSNNDLSTIWILLLSASSLLQSAAAAPRPPLMPIRHFNIIICPLIQLAHSADLSDGLSTDDYRSKWSAKWRNRGGGLRPHRDIFTQQRIASPYQFWADALLGRRTD